MLSTTNLASASLRVRPSGDPADCHELVTAAIVAACRRYVEAARLSAALDRIEGDVGDLWANVVCDERRDSEEHLIRVIRARAGGATGPAGVRSGGSLFVAVATDRERPDDFRIAVVQDSAIVAS